MKDLRSIHDSCRCVKARFFSVVCKSWAPFSSTFSSIKHDCLALHSEKKTDNFPHFLNCHSYWLIYSSHNPVSSNCKTSFHKKHKTSQVPYMFFWWKSLFLKELRLPRKCSQIKALYSPSGMWWAKSWKYLNFVLQSIVWVDVLDYTSTTRKRAAYPELAMI